MKTDWVKKLQLKEWAEAFIIAGALAIFLRTFFFQMYKIPTQSMVPTLVPGDKIFVTKMVYGPKVPFTDLRIPGMRKPKRGEVVVFIPPHERNKAYIKRLVGLPGDEIFIKRGNLYVNGELIIEPVIAKNNYIAKGEYGEGKIKVPEGKYYFLGDNSYNSADSRMWGFADEKDVVGKAIFIWWPPKRIGIIE